MSIVPMMIKMTRTTERPLIGRVVMCGVVVEMMYQQIFG